MKISFLVSKDPTYQRVYA